MKLLTEEHDKYIANRQNVNKHWPFETEIRLFSMYSFSFYLTGNKHLLGYSDHSVNAI